MRKEKGKKKMLNLETKMLKRSELPERYMANILFEWDNKKFKDKYLKKLDKRLAKCKEKEKQVPLEIEL